jgi:hypothetical protein
MENNFNIHECEGRRDGLVRDTLAICIRWQALQNMRKLAAPILVCYEDNYKIYKAAFLNAYKAG